MLTSLTFWNSLSYERYHRSTIGYGIDEIGKVYQKSKRLIKTQINAIYAIFRQRIKELINNLDKPMWKYRNTMNYIIKDLQFCASRFWSFYNYMVGFLHITID